MYFAQKLANYNNLELNLFLFDPVPGNLVTTSKFTDIGCIKCSTANRCYNLTRCGKTLQSVLAVYPYEPLPDLAFHAPVFGTYPRETYVEEDVTYGRHQGALFRPRTDFACKLSCLRIRDWLIKYGSWNHNADNRIVLGINASDLETEVLRELDKQIEYNKKVDTNSNRLSHDKNCFCFTTQIKYISNIVHEENKKHIFINKYHKQLKKKLQPHYRP
eukprot:UN05695